MARQEISANSAIEAGYRCRWASARHVFGDVQLDRYPQDQLKFVVPVRENTPTFASSSVRTHPADDLRNRVVACTS